MVCHGFIQNYGGLVSKYPIIFLQPCISDILKLYVFYLELLKPGCTLVSSSTSPGTLLISDLSMT